MNSRFTSIYKKWVRLLCIVFLFVLWAGGINAGTAYAECSWYQDQNDFQNKNRESEPQTGLPAVSLESGSVKLRAEVARTSWQKARGLMFRDDLEEGQGMLFVYAADRLMTFWMKNTPLPLSIAYLSSEGVILEIHDLEPLCLETVQSISRGRYALETPRGWFDRKGLGPGDRFRIPSLPSDINQ